MLDAALGGVPENSPSNDDNKPTSVRDHAATSSAVVDDIPKVRSVSPPTTPNVIMTWVYQNSFWKRSPIPVVSPVAKRRTTPKAVEPAISPPSPSVWRQQPDAERQTTPKAVEPAIPPPSPSVWRQQLDAERRTTPKAVEPPSLSEWRRRQQLQPLRTPESLQRVQRARSAFLLKQGADGASQLGGIFGKLVLASESTGTDGYCAATELNV